MLLQIKYMVGQSEHLIQYDTSKKAITAVRRKEIFTGGEHGVDFIGHEGAWYGFYGTATELRGKELPVQEGDTVEQTYEDYLNDYESWWGR